MKHADEPNALRPTEPSTAPADVPAGPWMDLNPENLQADEPSRAPDVSRADVSRRGFLRALGISGVVSAAACQKVPIRKALPYLVSPEDVRPGLSVRYASLCEGCGAACGTLVTVRDGRPIKLEGHPDNPLSRGGLCARGQAEVRGLYDAGRYRRPQLGGAPTTWAAIDKLVTDKLAAVTRSGKKVFLVTPSLSGRGARRACEAFVTAHGALWLEIDDALDPRPAIAEAYRLLDGVACVPAWKLDSCELFVGFGADVLGTCAEPVAFTQAYAARRKERFARATFSHIQIESTPSLTGAAADERIVGSANERLALLLWLAQELARGDTTLAPIIAALGAAAPLPEHLRQTATRLGDLLRAAQGKALVISGSTDCREQVLAACLNRVLGHEGHSLDLTAPSLTSRGRLRTYAELALALDHNEVGAVVVVGKNPLEESAELATRAQALSALPLFCAVDSRPTATARAAQVVAAAHHSLESWSDAESRPGLHVLGQPTVEALFETRQALASLLVWSGRSADYRAHLEAAWRDEVLAGEAFDRAVARGLVDQRHGSAAVATNPGTDAAGLAALAPFEASDSGAGPGLALELTAEVGVGDGRGVSNPWLRELPDPLTRVSWVACARFAPTRAAALGLTDGDLVRLGEGEHRVELPVRILPGQHPDVVGVPVGYGLIDGDGGGAPRNGWNLASTTPTGVRTAGIEAGLTKLGFAQTLPLMQPQSDTAGRPIVQQVRSVAAAVERPHVPHADLWPERGYSTRWEMVVNLDACTGCSGCVIACQAENNIPVVGPDQMTRHRDMHWLRIDRYFVGDADNPEILFEPMACAHCEDAPCETVCPVAATVHSADGLNQQAYNRCVGTRYCANNCPYKTRRFNWYDYKPTDPIERLVLNPDVVVRDRGVMEKCTFCVQRIQAARLDAKARGEPEWTVKTACQESCPAQAITFGNGASPTDPVSLAKEGPRAFRVLEELGVGPAITYQARLRPRRDGEPT